MPAARVGWTGEDSNWWISAAPCRCAVPRQSAPVSPPPMITTRLPFALIGDVSRSPCCTRLDGGRYSIAWYTPLRSRPGTGRSRHCVAPPASTTASNSACSSLPVTSTPTLVLTRNSVPSSRICSSRRSRYFFSILNSGNAVAEQTADSIGAVEDHDVVPGAGVSCCAAARPAGPEPTTATRLPVDSLASTGLIQPSFHARLDDFELDLLDGDRIAVDTEHARGLTRSRAEATCELGEVVGRVEALERALPNDRGIRGR